MPSREELLDALTNADKAATAGDKQAALDARSLADMIIKMDAPSAPVDKAGQETKKWRAVGEQMGPGSKRLLSAIQGPTFGFGDEIVGGLGAVASRFGNGPASELPFGEAYRGMRDVARGAGESFQKSNPWEAGATQIAASLPYAGPYKAVNALLPSSMGPVTRAVVPGVVFGAVAGAGGAKEMADIPGDAAVGAATGGVMSGATQATMSGVNGIYNMIAPRVSGKSADYLAGNRVAEAFARDKTSASDAAATMGKLGGESRIADAGGSSVRGLLDTMATLPGATKDKLEQAIRDRQAGRFNRLVSEAEQLMNVGTRRLPQTLTELDTVRQQQSKPLYDQVRKAVIPVDTELSALLERAKPAFSEAKTLAGVRGESFTLSDKLSDSIPLSQMDTLKRSLYDKAYANINPETGKLNETGRAWNELRQQLVKKLDKLTEDGSGRSFYKAARDAYAGPTELRNAAMLGSQSMSKEAWKVAETTAGMSQSELQAFRVGAMEALRTKLGTEGGQTNMLKFWKEANTSSKLKEIFPSERLFQEFAQTLMNEGKLKALESVGRGSQTASRLAAIEDVNSKVAQDVGQGVKAAANGRIGGVIQAGRDIYSKVSTPESVRDSIGRILLTQDKSAAGNELNMIKNIIEQELQKRNAQAVASPMIGINALRTMSQ
jgi:hypothetical protein